MTSALSDYDALALLASWECIEALRDLYCIACIQQMQNKHQAKSSSMLQSQAKPSSRLWKRCRWPRLPRLAICCHRLCPNCSIFNQVEIISIRTKPLENVARCRWKNTAACAQCAAQPPLRLRPPVEKCPSVEKQVSARWGRSSAWVIDCPPPHRGSAWICFTKWICFGRGSIFLSRHWIIDRWQSVCWHREKEARSVVAKKLP